ncbi:FAD/NAD(P)-binding domain-containing protein [Aspergillus heterothallicus]
MTIPSKTTVLIIGGGPAGSYTASVLAREGIDAVLLEADTFPRYHIGESGLPSLRHYLRFIDLDEQFVKHGFTKKCGAAFKVTPGNREAYTDFTAAGGPEGYTWNMIRSESDEMLFRHAGKSGAKIFDGVKVTELQFDKTTLDTDAENQTGSGGPGRPVSASYVRKASDGESASTGTIQFNYLVDASGRAGVLGTRYLKNRQYTQALKNVAHWAYYRGGGKYAPETPRENSPFFEALNDESGWVWFIPLHDGTHSVGVVRHQSIATAKKAAAGSTEAYYEDALASAPIISSFLNQNGAAERVTPVHTASDYSYASPTYNLPYARIVGDAGCFIDPLFSSGIHLALTGGLSAATTIAASIRGDVPEDEAGRWHSTKIAQGYARFLLVVLSAYKQMWNQSTAVLHEVGEDHFDRAFDIFRPVIQGEADTDKSAITQTELNTSMNPLLTTLDPRLPNFLSDDKAVDKAMSESSDEDKRKELEMLVAMVSGHGLEVLTMGDYTTDVIDGHLPRLERGALTLIPAGKKE